MPGRYISLNLAKARNKDPSETCGPTIGNLWTPHSERGVGGEAGVEHQLAGQGAGALAVGVDKVQDGVAPVLLAQGGVSAAEGVLLGVADEEGKHGAPAAAALGDGMLFEECLAAVAGDGVEVEGLGGIELAGGPWGQAAGGDAAGVPGEGGALRAKIRR